MQRSLTLAYQALMLLACGVACEANLLREQGGQSVTTVPAVSTTPGGDPPVATQPFAAEPPRVYVNKVKTLMSGLAASSNEIAAAQADPAALRDMVASWSKAPAFRQVLMNFFANEFQQRKTEALYFSQDIDAGYYYPEDQMLQNIRESFARTALQLIDEGKPFTTVANTNRFMTTTAMMTYFAYADTGYRDDNFNKGNRWFSDDPNWTFTLHSKGGPWTLVDSSNPNSPHYMQFFIPDLPHAWDYQSAAQKANCPTFDPMTFNNKTIFAGANEGIDVLHNIMYGGGTWWNFAPDAYTTPNTLCQGTTGRVASWLTPADYQDWRMVTIRPPAGTEKQDRFFDLAGLRASNTLKIWAPKVGFFTTPAFLSQWSTNVGNSARVTANQTLIVGLGEPVDGSDSLPLTTPSAVNPNHAKDPVCFACHQTLDPLRQFFRQDYSLAMGRQTDPVQKGLPATFSFRGVVQNGNGVRDLAEIVAAHPNFATAWTVKLCSWANSSPCLATDPEVQRIANRFAAGGHNFMELVVDMFSSPLVTYAASTASALANPPTVTILRRSQLCTLLNQRLGLTDVCDDAKSPLTTVNRVPLSVAQVPSDDYVRGSKTSVFVTAPGPFARSAIEQVCADVATQVIGTGSSSWGSKADVDGAIAKMVTDLMGVLPPDDSSVEGLLRSHYDAAVAANVDATLALQSTFVAACVAAPTYSLGQ